MDEGVAADVVINEMEKMAGGVSFIGVLVELHVGAHSCMFG